MSAVKHDNGKPRFDLLPPDALTAVADVFRIGADKYGERNWEHGIPGGFGRVYSALQRHAWAWWNGETHDQEDGQHHLASVAWCALVLLTYERCRPDLDTRSAQAGSEAPAPLKEEAGR
jgi:hypothetical protein